MIDVTELQSPAEAARFFRTVLSAFSTPATPLAVGPLPGAPEPLLPTTAAVILSLADYQTPVWLSPRLNTEAARKYIRFHTGAPVTQEPRSAAFALLEHSEVLAHIDQFSIGTDAYPDRSATLIVQCSGGFSSGHADASGPGLKATVPFGVSGTDGKFWQRLQMNAQLFPLGLDFLFAAPAAIAALPRSTRLAMKETA